MSRYYNFADFMTDVINEADSISRQNHNRGLEKLFAVSSDTLDTVTLVIGVSWYAFLMVVGLLLLGSFGFFAALVAFMSSPVGIAVAAALGIGAFAKIKKMYQEKVLPIAVKDVGEKYKSRWESVRGNQSAIDKLRTEASEELYNKALSATRNV